MNVISNGYLKEESNSSATYTIVIHDFKKKLAMATVGKYSSTVEFYVSWTTFPIKLYVAGVTEGNNMSIFLQNKSDWMVRARFEVSAKVHN